jgi:hypothetical protein
VPHQGVRKAHEERRPDENQHQGAAANEPSYPDEGRAYLGEIDLRHDPEPEHLHRLVGGEDRLSPIVNAFNYPAHSGEGASHGLGAF